MNRKQTILIALTALVHFSLAALCVWGDVPAPGNHHDILPLLTMFLMAPFLSTGVTLVIAGITRFWGKARRSWLALTSLAAMLAGFLFVYSVFLDEPFLWVRLLPWVLFQYGCSMVTLCIVRRVFRKFAQYPDQSL